MTSIGTALVAALRRLFPQQVATIDAIFDPPRGHILSIGPALSGMGRK